LLCRAQGYCGNIFVYRRAPEEGFFLLYFFIHDPGLRLFWDAGNAANGVMHRMSPDLLHTEAGSCGCQNKHASDLACGILVCMKRLFILVLILCWLAPAFALAPLRTQHFIFYAGAEGQKAAAYLAQSADAILQNMAASLGMQAGAVIDVYMVQDFEEWYRLRPDAGRLPSWAAGAAYPEKNCIVLLLNRGADLDKTFLHETHHMLLWQAFRGGERVPRWLDEGLAMIWADEWSLSRLNTMTMAVLSGKLLPMDELARHFSL
jgi:hypothetical protein